MPYDATAEAWRLGNSVCPGEHEKNWTICPECAARFLQYAYDTGRAEPGGEFVLTVRDATPDRLLAENAHLRSLLREVEWSDAREEYGACPACGGFTTATPRDWLGPDTRAHFIGHAPDCRLSAALTDTP